MDRAGHVTDPPTPLQMVEQLHKAFYGSMWARPESPEQVWNELLERVRVMAEGKCGECLKLDRGEHGEAVRSQA